MPGGPGLGDTVHDLGPNAGSARVVAAVAGELRGVNVEDLRLAGIIRDVLGQAGLTGPELERGSDLVPALSGLGAGQLGFGQGAVRAWFADRSVRSALRVHDWQGREYFEREAWEDWLPAIAAAANRPRSTRRGVLVRAAADAGYDVAGLLSRLSPGRLKSERGGRQP